jgi:hypothetical protein
LKKRLKFVEMQKHMILVCLFAIALQGCAALRGRSEHETRRCAEISAQADVEMEIVAAELKWPPNMPPIKLRSLAEVRNDFTFELSRPKLPRFPSMKIARGAGGYAVIQFQGVKSKDLQPLEGIRIARSNLGPELQAEVVGALNSWRFRAGPKWDERTQNVDRLNLLQQIVFCPTICTDSERRDGCVSEN